MTLKKILHDAITLLENNKIENAEHDATEILLNLIDMDMARFLFECDDEMEKKYEISSITNLISEFDELINARAIHFPLQYILGETYFCGLKFEIDRNVLIPRQDTEVLVEKVLADNPDKNKFVLDLCTGSGCIAVSLAMLGNYKLIVGTDISEEALQIASKNAEALIPEYEFDNEMNQHIYFLRSNVFDNVDKINEKLGIDKFDIITCNPPYIRTDDISTLQEEIREYEPILALDGDKDGLKYYKIIAKDASKFLNPNGMIYLEIGYNQANDVKKIFEKYGYKFIEIVKDLNKNDRIIVFKL